MSSENHTYGCTVIWDQALRGRVDAPGRPPLSVGAAPEFGGTDDVWSPEHLTAAAVNTCIMLTFIAIAGNSKIAVTAYSSNATATLETAESHGMVITSVKVQPRITVPSGTDMGRVERIVRMAERNCFISNSLTGTVVVEPEIVTG